MLPPFFYPLIVQLLNALLARESWARDRLRPHAGKAVRLVLGSFDLTLAVSTTGSLQSTRQASPNVTVTVAASDLPRLLNADAQQRMQVVRIDGEAALAHTVSDLARDLRWDVEDELAGLLGDIPARLILRTLRGITAAARETGTRLSQNAVEYATHETDLLPNRPALSAWAADVSALELATQALGERIAALERSKGRP